MKILVLINEDFQEMILGQNTSLSYILAACELGHEVYIHKISKKFTLNFTAIYLDKISAKNLIAKFKEENVKLAGLTIIPNLKVKDLPEIFQQKEISTAQIDFIIQRLEPMKAPFPPIGEIDPKNYLKKLTQIFPNKVFNNPANCYEDKELPLILEANKFNLNFLSTPTATSEIDDLRITQKITGISTIYQKLYKTTLSKIVLKPQTAAQGLGVFLMEICVNGDDLNKLQNRNLEELLITQYYKIAPHQNLQEIVNILCYVQNCKANNFTQNILIKNLAAEKINEGQKNLYHNQILIQPFLEGIALGDIRINLAKNSQGYFFVAGAVLRKNINLDEKNFTTGITAGHATAARIEEVLNEEEQNDLEQKINFILQKLNGDLRKKYKNSLELGCDFILVGLNMQNRKQVLLGEINHYCQALLPHSEAVEYKAQNNSFYKKINCAKIKYDGGLAIAKYIIEEQIKLK